MNDSDLDRLLRPLRDVEPDPVSRVSIEEAVRAGRRKRTQRTVLATVAAVIVSLVALPPLVSGWARQDIPPAEFVQTFHVGSAGGFTPYRWHSDRVDLKWAGTPDPAEPIAWISFSEAEKAPPGAEAPDVHGRPARWVVEAGRSGVAWEVKDGIWGHASVPGSDQEARDRAHRVAQSVRP